MLSRFFPFILAFKNDVKISKLLTGMTLLQYENMGIFFGIQI